MANDTKSPALSDDQRLQIVAMLALGCDREMAAKRVGSTPSLLRAAILRDAEFSAQVRRAEGSAELMHMRNIQAAAADEKNWRASAWWLERRSPERFGRRKPGVVTPSQMQAFAEWLIEAIGQEVRDADDRERLVARIRQASGAEPATPSAAVPKISAAEGRGPRETRNGEPPGANSADPCGRRDAC